MSVARQKHAPLDDFCSDFEEKRTPRVIQRGALFVGRRRAAANAGLELRARPAAVMMIGGSERAAQSSKGG
jgi:hypothetical protein